MNTYVDCDFETRSACDLRAAGAWRYAEDATTEILCFAWERSDFPGVMREWTPGEDTGETKALLNAIRDGAIFIAHNAGFEQAIWDRIMVPVYGFPPLPPERWDCTLAACAWKVIPLRLDKAASALRLPVEKDMEGNRLTLGMSRFDKHGNWPELTSEKLDRISAYCGQDVVVERKVAARIGLLSKESQHERKVWLLDQKINQRGVRIDLDFVRQAGLVVARATKPLLAEFRELTGGVNPGQVAKVIEWAGGQGVALENLQKGYLDGLLGGQEDTDDAGYESRAELGEDDLFGAASAGLPEGVRRVLEIRQMLGSASIKKLKRMRACVGHDGRARGLLQYHAAGPGRWGGRLLQPQNFPRGTIKFDPETAVSAIMSGDAEYVEMVLGVPAIEAVASSLRHALIPDPGKTFLVGDFAGIEARIVLALAGQHDKAEMMAAGKDVYLDMAEAIYRLPKGSLSKADTEKRQVGKNTVLGCGFQMGAPKFHARYCPDQPIEFAEGVIDAYRKVWAPRVPKLWYALDEAAFAAATGSPDQSHGITYRLEDGWLTARLPSGWQKLWYYDPRLGDNKFGNPSWNYSAHKTGKSIRVDAYGGLLTENAVQALARGLLAASMMRLEEAGMPVVLTVHDETVCEVDAGAADLAGFEQLMAEPTKWSREIKIPISVEAWEGARYRK